MKGRIAASCVSPADAHDGDKALSSRQLLFRARQGDESALDLLFGCYLDPLTRWARGRLPRGARDLMQTDDLVQETLMRSMRGLAAFDPQHSGAFLAYLRRAVLNRIRDELRRVARRPAHDEAAEGAVDPRPNPVESAIGREAAERYEHALDCLSPETREAVLARIELGLGFTQIAEMLGKPSPDAARMTVSRALVRLAEAMADV